MKDNQAQDHRDMIYTDIVAKIDSKFIAVFTASTYRDQILKSGFMCQLYTYLRS